MYRDFIYLDLERIQSVIAQLNEGLLTEVIAEHTKEITGKIGASTGLTGLIASLLSFNVEGTAGYTSNAHTSKVLHDYTFNIALETLKDKKLILLDKDLLKSKLSIPSAAFVLIHGNASIIDYSIANDMLSSTSLQSLISGSDTGQQDLNRQQRRAKGITPNHTNPTVEVFNQITSIIESFMKDLLLVNIKLSNGTTFIGPLSRQFLREEISSIIFKYGKEVQDEWTMLAQVSSSPTTENKLEKLQDFTDKLNTLVITQQSGGTILDQLNPVIEFVYGLQEAVASVSYPSIAVTPIAVFRELNEIK